MQYRNLGSTGVRVSTISLGCMAFGRWIDESESQRIVDAAFDAGINLFDTADVYGRGMDTHNPLLSGESEAILGKALRGRRHQVVLATKVHGRVGTGPNDQGLTRYHIHQAIDNSLSRLQTDHIDLYQVHRFDENTPLEETLRALDDLVKAGKVRYIGCSNFAAWQIAKAHGISNRENLARFVSVQPQYSLIAREIETELLPFCRSEQVGVIVYSPLARGLLTGKYQSGQYPQGSRAQIGEARILDLLSKAKHQEIVQRVQNWAREHDFSLPNLALAWVLHQPGVTSAILGASKAQHIADALPALEVSLNENDLRELDELSRA